MVVSEVHSPIDPARYYRRYTREFAGRSRAGACGCHQSGGAHRHADGAGHRPDGVEAVRSCHDARRDQLAALADDLLDCYMSGTSERADKARLVDFVTAEVIEQIAAEDDAFRPLATAGGASLIHALPAGPALLQNLLREIVDNHHDVAVAAATGALVLLMDARSAVENEALLPAVTRSPDRETTVASLLNCCSSADAASENHSEWWIG